MLNELARKINENAKAHGWWDEKRSFGEIVALCHSELSEALEEHRNGRLPNEVYFKGTTIDEINAVVRVGKPEGIAVEMADCIIRILDWCGAEGIDIDEIMRLKMAYNETRPYRHGGKVI